MFLQLLVNLDQLTDCFSSSCVIDLQMKERGEKRRLRCSVSEAGPSKRSRLQHRGEELPTQVNCSPPISCVSS